MKLPDAMSCLNDSDRRKVLACFGDPPMLQRPRLADVAAILFSYVGTCPELQDVVSLIAMGAHGEDARPHIVVVFARMDAAIAIGRKWADRLWAASTPLLRKGPWPCWEVRPALDRLKLNEFALGAQTLAVICLRAAARRWEELPSTTGTHMSPEAEEALRASGQRFTDQVAIDRFENALADIHNPGEETPPEKVLADLVVWAYDRGKTAVLDDIELWRQEEDRRGNIGNNGINALRHWIEQRRGKAR